MKKHGPKKNICFIITKSEIGGAQRWVSDVVNSLDNEYSVTIVTNAPGWLGSQVKNSNVNFFYINKLVKRNSLSSLFHIRKILKKNSIDILVLSSANAGFYGRISALFLNIKTIYVSHGWSSLYRGGHLKFLFSLIEKILSWLPNVVLCVSDSDKTKAINLIGINETKVDVLKTKIFDKNRNNLSYKLKNKNKKIDVLTITRLDYPKRVDLLINAVKNTDYNLHIIGDGILKNDLMNLSFGCENIYFLGEFEEFSQYNEFDIFSLISDSEGLPLSPIEAMSHGLPLLLSDVGGCSELIHKNGILVENNELSIFEGLEIIKNNLELFSRQSSILYKENFSLNNDISHYQKYFDKKIKNNVY
tara:strand:- start:609 stop:1688 length:1080 start_codon:yes stop_codon:yes gene_type:complete